MDAYWKYQGEKEKKLYAVIEAFAQNSGQLGITDARYVNALKLFIQGVTPLEYYAHRGFAHLARQFGGDGLRLACLYQSADELRHYQTETHAMSVYNKYFNGMHESNHWFDRVWYLSVPKSFFEDALTAGPFEFLTAVSFSFEYVLTNLLFVPFMSGAAHNGDMSTVTFGFSAQSDESRHMTLGIEAIKFMLEQDPANVPIIQRWIDKWFWRGYRLLTIVAMMQDYMLPKRVMSWKEAWELYAEEAGGALFKDLARYGIREPKGWARRLRRQGPHQPPGLEHLLQLRRRRRLPHLGAGSRRDEVAVAEVPAKLRQVLPPALRALRRAGRAGQALLQRHAADAVHHLPDPDAVHRAGRSALDRLPRDAARWRHLPLLQRPLPRDLRFRFEPEKYRQSWLPVHQIYQGHCFKPDADPTKPDFNPLGEVLRYYEFNLGRDNMDFEGSEDQRHFHEWGGGQDAKEGQL